MVNGDTLFQPVKSRFVVIRRSGIKKQDRKSSRPIFSQPIFIGANGSSLSPEAVLEFAEISCRILFFSKKAGEL
jgi:hypothetical protein